MFWKETRWCFASAAEQLLKKRKKTFRGVVFLTAGARADEVGARHDTDVDARDFRVFRGRVQRGQAGTEGAPRTDRRQH